MRGLKNKKLGKYEDKYEITEQGGLIRK